MNRLRVFEVRCRDAFGLKTLHFEAKSHKQAVKKAGKYKVVGVRKADASKIFGDITKLQLEQQPLGYYIGDGLYDTDINLDEMLGLRRAKRIRINKEKKNGT